MAGARRITTVIKERRGSGSVDMLLQRLTVLFEISKAWDQAPQWWKKEKNEVKKKKNKTKIQSSGERWTEARVREATLPRSQTSARLAWLAEIFWRRSLVPG